MLRRSRRDFYDLGVLRENLASLRENIREALGFRRRPFLRRFRVEEEREPEVIIIREEGKTREERLQRLRKGYVKEQFPEVEEVEQKTTFQGLGIRGFLRTLFEETSEQIRLRTERERLMLEKERKQVEEEKRWKRREYIHY